MPVKPKTGVKMTTANVMPDVLNNVIDAMPENESLPRIAKVGETNPVTGRAYTESDSVASLRSIGEILTTMPQTMNNFYNTLWNMVAFIIIRSKIYENPLARWTKKGIVQLGETIEDIFVGMANVYQFSPSNAEKNVFAREKDEPSVAFYKMNFQKYYKMTYSIYETRQAFLSFEGVNDMLTKKIEQMYTAMEYDEYIMTKYMAARVILNGYMYPVAVQQMSGSTARDVTTTIIAAAKDAEFMKSKYNVAGVTTRSSIDEELIFLTPTDYANLRVQVLATSFNREDAELMGHVIVFDGFEEWDYNRMEMLFTDEDGVVDEQYSKFTEAEMALLSTTSMFMVDREFFQIYDNLLTTDNLKNPEGLYSNYWLHKWTTFAVSPFANAMVFTNGVPAVSAVTITPTAITSPVGSTAQFNATVTTTNLASKNVRWTVTGNTDVDTFIDYRGLLRIGKHEKATTLNVYAKSQYDQTKVASAVVTVGIPTD